MAKRGQIVFKALIVLLISAIIIILYPIMGQTHANREISKNTIAAREIALIIDTLYSYPYDVVVYLDKDLSGLTVDFSDENIKIYDTKLGKKFDPALAEYRFFTTGFNVIETKLESPKRIKFEKTKNILIVKKDENIK